MVEYARILFSLIFYAAFIIYLLLGAYVLYLNSKAVLNRVFFFVLIFLSIWTIGLFFANSSTDMKTCLIWRRVSAFGWGSIFSLLLHFFLLYTGRNKILKKWWVYIPLYLPAAITVYVFSLSNKMAILQYNLQNMPLGWANITVNNVWDWFFDFYYITYMILGLILLLVRRARSHSESTRKEALLIFSTFMAALVLGSITDIFLNSLTSSALPQMAPVIILIPVFAILYSIRRYGFLNVHTINADVVILTDSTRKKLFRIVSIAFAIMAVLVVALKEFPVLIGGHGDLKTSLFSIGMILIFITTLLFVQRIKSTDLQDYLNLAVLTVLIPSIMQRFIQFSVNTIWVFPILFILSSLVFNRKLILLTISATAVLSQIIVMGNKTKRNGDDQRL